MRKVAYGVAAALEWLVAIFAALGVGGMIIEATEKSTYSHEFHFNDDGSAVWAIFVILPVYIFPWSVNLLSGAFSLRSILTGDQRWILVSMSTLACALAIFYFPEDGRWDISWDNTWIPLILVALQIYLWLRFTASKPRSNRLAVYWKSIFSSKEHPSSSTVGQI
jgi:hypothetical protein